MGRSSSPPPPVTPFPPRFPPSPLFPFSPPPLFPAAPRLRFPRPSSPLFFAQRLVKPCPCERRGGMTGGGSGDAGRRGRGEEGKKGRGETRRRRGEEGD